ncbi:isochorismate synthase [Corallococcus praedator]|uniref:isochorismate synthase n=1 Tax=Corallococcus praedator TaxID=2316724 RepID=A0ABX9QRU8_9BACT|nr:MULTISPECIES: isochorismate synthase [Corallococcus]RKH21843.1 isochorismate synthase [Corallococcus sp. CA047B]RKH36484.1 isochorismate synthase [Corallococcus sp. CA031C]RKI16319.1 isochorismate synthase [Corallococcus praedator]
MTPLSPAEGPHWVAGMMLLAGVDPLAGAGSLGVPSLYWERPVDREAAAGWGEAGVREAHVATELPSVLGALGHDSVRWLGPVPTRMPGPWFGGMRFSPTGQVDGAWRSHGLARWTLPEVLVWREDNALYVAAFATEAQGGEDTVRSRLERVRASFPEGYRHAQGAPVALRTSSSRRDFEALVDRAVEAISTGPLHKVVLARAMDAEGPEPFDVVDVLARLREQNPRCATFLFRAPDGTGFLGATPETLCRVDGRVLETEALAGSAAPGAEVALDASDKDQREHAAVVRYILQALQPVAASVSADAQPSVLALKNVMHLRTGIRARLGEGVDTAQVVTALHPTPAVGGAPRELALSFLVEHEALDRGWYAGPVGWVGPGRAHLVVALRSALVRGAHARLFVGAGVVAGSSAESEWRETEMKSLAMLRALGGGDVVRR